MTAQELATALERATSWLRRAHPPGEWNAVALSTLDALDRRGPLRVTALVAQERLSQPGMTSVIARLAAAGLVQRRPDPSDGRATLVSATPAGSGYVRALHAARAETVAVHVAALPADAQRALADATHALELLAAREVLR